ncbi:MAG: hypothetical protein JNL21_14835 [Myxococcales bacterium]|nr:hypothetical protein [Myxococcales bacterium]
MRYSFVSSILVVLAVACGDDETKATGGGGQGGGGTGAGGQGTGGDGGSGGSGGEAPRCGGDVTTAALAGGAWDPRFTIAGVASQYGIAPVVHDFAVDSDGSVIAAGRFDTLASETVPPLLRFTNGTWEPARTTWEIPPPGDGFSAVAVSPSGALALATNDSFGDMSGEIWIDEGDGLVSVGSFDGRVRRLAFFEGQLWVAGFFSLDAGGSAVENLAVWDGAAWSTPPGGAVDGPVFELTVDGPEFLVGGAFGSIGGTAAANVAVYDGSTWIAHDFDGALAIYALARDGGELYAGGAFGDFMEASGVARWEGDTWAVVAGGLAQYQTRGVVTELVAHDGVLDATGCFNSAGGLDGDADAIAARSFARYDGSAWRSLDDGALGAVSPWFAPLACGDEGLTAVWDVPNQTVAAAQGLLFAGGSFAGAGGVASQSLVTHDGTSWAAAGEAELGIAGSLDRIAAGGSACDVYGVGAFSHVAGARAAGRVVHFDGTSWTSLGDSLPADAWCPAIDVSPEGEVAVGCMVFPTAGDAVGVILKREGNEMVETEVPGLGPVMVVKWSPEGTLWVGGGAGAGFLARIDGTDVTVVESELDGQVQYIDAASDTDIVVAGPFQWAGGVAARRIARWDGTTWSPLADGLPGAPTALARDGSLVYASTYDEGEGAYLLGLFDGTEWRELATPGSGVTKQNIFNFNALTVVDGAVIAGGAIELDDGTGRGVVVYRDGVFSASKGGVSAISVGGLALTNDALWVAGAVTAAGPSTEPVSSVGVARLVLP